MDIKDMRSSLQMKDFYFSRFSFVRDKVIKDGELNVDLQKNIISKGDHEYNIILTTTIEKDDMNIELVAEAQFLYESDDYSREESIINTNTVAIMFPFIRSQVTLLTSQPGMIPIILPAINTQKLK
ncbi:MAG: preprotein translocase subunit SecB [Lachnospiraceae bacterium]|nr:MAG: preprotein translocase subunit SecB [Lachnospiraceae bacterium]